MKNQIKKIALLTSGGDAPGMNASIRSVVRACVFHNIIPVGVECIFVRQAEQLGLGHAVLCAERAVGDEPLRDGAITARVSSRTPYCF